MSDALRDELRELAQDIPWDRPDAARRDALRSSLLIAAADTPPKKDRRWLVAGAAFAAGAVAAAAVAIVVVRGGSDARTGEPQQVTYAGGAAQITTTAASRIEHKVVSTPTGVDEIVRVLDGTVRLTVDEVRTGDHVRVRTRDAEVEGAGDYEVVVAGEALSAVTVRSGTAHVRVDGQRAVFLSAGQTWRAAVITADDISPRPAKVATVDTVTTAPDKPDAVDPDTGKRDATKPDGMKSDADTLAKSNAAPSRDAVATTKATTRATNGTPDRDAATVRDANSSHVAPTTKTDAATANSPAAPAKVDGSTTQPDAAAVRDANSGPVRDAAPTTSTTKPDATTATRDAAPAKGDGATKPAAATVSSTAKPDAAPTTSTTKPDGSITTGVATTPAQKAKSETERRFEAGWKLLRDGKAREAAVELAAAADAGPDDALAADARYFQAVALVRSGQGRAAENVLVAFLDHAPKSLRRGRAAVLLGRLLAERGDVESARAWYKSAVDDPDAGVAAAARAGLDALPARR